jgi:hypothetical protein
VYDRGNSELPGEREKLSQDSDVGTRRDKQVLDGRRGKKVQTVLGGETYN